MRRILLALLTAAALIIGIAPDASALTCAKVVQPKPCKTVKRCVWGGDPDALYVEVRAATKKTALARAAKVLKNIKAAKVTPRIVDIYAFKGHKRVKARTYRLKTKHWYYSEKKQCWYIR